MNGRPSFPGRVVAAADDELDVVIAPAHSRQRVTQPGERSWSTH
ncbi:hypothetical protein ACWEKR_30155 [Nocardia sp. NPDC004573]